MELASKLKWLVVVFILLFTLVFVGWGLSAIARNVFNRSSSTSESVVSTLGSTIDDVDTVKLTVDGPVVASKDHRSYVIEASRGVVSMTVYSGYGQSVIDKKSYKNNTNAYENLVQALKKAKATSRIKGTSIDDDFEERGSCPAGRRYILELGDDERRWSTSCSSVKGTAGGKMKTIRDLFKKQIPDFKELVKDTKLNR